MTGARAAGVVALLALVGGGWAAPAHAAPPSSTTLVLSSPTSAYGQSVTASAQVAIPGDVPAGDVVFTVDGTAIKANLRGDGSASIVLPRALAGQHTVTASFDPQFDDQQQASASPTQAWVVIPAPTQLQTRVTGRGAHVPTSVVVTASGEYGTPATGAVTVTIRHLGTRRSTRRERTLDATGSTTARFGILRTGTYRLRVTYAGDAQHAASRRFAKFTVRQR